MLVSIIKIVWHSMCFPGFGFYFSILVKLENDLNNLWMKSINLFEILPLLGAILRTLVKVFFEWLDFLSMWRLQIAVICFAHSTRINSYNVSAHSCYDVDVWVGWGDTFPDSPSWHPRLAGRKCILQLYNRKCTLWKASDCILATPSINDSDVEKNHI